MPKYNDFEPHGLLSLLENVVYNSLDNSHHGLIQNWYNEILKLNFYFKEHQYIK